MAWTDEARAAAAEARKNRTSSKERIIDSTKVFGKNVTDNLPNFGKSNMTSSKMKVALTSLVATQSTLAMSGIRKYKTGGGAAIDVIQKGNKFIIMDGHHRAAAAIRKNKKAKNSFATSFVSVNVLGKAK